MKSNLIRVFNQVEEDINAGFYVIPQSDEKIKFKNVSNLKNETIEFKDHQLLIETPISIRKYFPKPEIYTQNIDTFLKAIDLGQGTAVLNMASKRNPGGGVTSGSRAQEEELCRRSNLILSLYRAQKKGEYPISDYGAIYTPWVNIYRHPETYEPMPAPVLTNVISASMIVHPKLNSETGEIEKSLVHIVKKKIRSVLRVAILTGNTKLVLGAWGCGAYKCPSKHIAKLFKRILDEEEFKNSFEEICFAILEDHNSIRLGNPDGNFKPFSEIFGTK